MTQFLPSLLFLNMPAVGARRRKFAQAVPDHILGDVDRHMAASIMHSNGVPDHLGKDGAGTAPSADDLLLPAFIHGFDPF
jgi:hypothetical protein